MQVPSSRWLLAHRLTIRLGAKQSSLAIVAVAAVDRAGGKTASTRRARLADGTVGAVGTLRPSADDTDGAAVRLRAHRSGRAVTTISAVRRSGRNTADRHAALTCRTIPAVGTRRSSVDHDADGLWARAVARRTRGTVITIVAVYRAWQDTAARSTDFSRRTRGIRIQSDHVRVGQLGGGSDVGAQGSHVSGGSSCVDGNGIAEGIDDSELIVGGIQRDAICRVQSRGCSGDGTQRGNIARARSWEYRNGIAATDHIDLVVHGIHGEATTTRRKGPQRTRVSRGSSCKHRKTT